uniref:Putative secreted protein n=1 Tax=Anopheles triannulatus TaxID=58253 RepID=A0A2M4B2D5_9DIPT
MARQGQWKYPPPPASLLVFVCKTMAQQWPIGDRHRFERCVCHTRLAMPPPFSVWLFFIFRLVWTLPPKRAVLKFSPKLQPLVQNENEPRAGGKTMEQPWCRLSPRNQERSRKTFAGKSTTINQHPPVCRRDATLDFHLIIHLVSMPVRFQFTIKSGPRGYLKPVILAAHCRSPRCSSLLISSLYARASE